MTAAFALFFGRRLSRHGVFSWPFAGPHCQTHDRGHGQTSRHSGDVITHDGPPFDVHLWQRTFPTLIDELNQAKVGWREKLTARPKSWLTLKAGSQYASAWLLDSQRLQIL